MDDILAVRGFQSLRQLHAQFQHVLLWKRLLAQHLVQIDPGNIFRDQVVNATFLPEVEGHGDVGMTQLANRQRLRAELSAGSIVGEQSNGQYLDRDVAVKILPIGLFTDDATRRQFRTEALAVGKLSHSNIAMAFDFGEERGIDYLVTEYIPGVNLDQMLGQQPLPQKDVLELGMQLAKGLEAAHRENVIHRDLKPGNLRINPDGQLKILDFGLAKLVEPIELAETANLNTSLSVTGTLPYMAPELLRAETTDARTDIWAAGAVLYEMATGKR